MRRKLFIIMVLSKQKKRLQTASHAIWNAALDKSKAMLMYSKVIMKHAMQPHLKLQFSEEATLEQSDKDNVVHEHYY